MATVDLNARFAANLRHLRVSLGLSQESLAAAAHLHRTYIGGVERGERRVTLRTVEKIAMALKVDPLDLLGEPAAE